MSYSRDLVPFGSDAFGQTPRSDVVSSSRQPTGYSGAMSYSNEYMPSGSTALNGHTPGSDVASSCHQPWSAPDNTHEACDPRYRAITVADRSYRGDILRKSVP
jgi:hypothetical protein